MADQNLNTYRDYVYNIPEYILFNPAITLLQIKIYSLIRSFNERQQIAFCSNNWIANRLQVDRSSVIRAINKLCDFGFIERIEIDGRRYLQIKLCPLLHTISMVISTKC
jgi:DNA-binding MarR family transcriptional regulator